RKMMPARRRWTLIGMIVGVVVLVLGLFAVLIVQLKTGRRIDVRQTIHHQHLLFATQLRDDGSLDYQMRIAELFATPIDPELNFVVALRAVAPKKGLTYTDLEFDFLAVESRRRPHFRNPSEPDIATST